MGYGSFAEGVDIIAVGCAADVDVRLPDVATGGSMTVFHDVVALERDLVVYGKMGVSAEQLVAALEAAQQGEELREAR